MDLGSLAVPDHRVHVGLFGHFVQIGELLFLLVVADRSDRAADDDGHQDGHALHPELVFLFPEEQLHHHGDHRRYHENDQHLIAQCLPEDLPQSPHLPLREDVVPVLLPVLLHRPRAEALLHRRVKY